MAFLRTTLMGLSTNRAFVAVKRNIVMSLATTMNVCTNTKHLDSGRNTYKKLS